MIPHRMPLPYPRYRPPFYVSVKVVPADEYYRMRASIEVCGPVRDYFCIIKEAPEHFDDLIRFGVIDNKELEWGLEYLCLKAFWRYLGAA